MPDAEGHTRDNDSGFDIILCDGLKQQTAEDHFLQESDAEHTYNPADRFHRCVIEGDTVPDVTRCQNYHRHIVKEPAGRNR